MSLIVCGNRYTDDGGSTYNSIWCYSDASTLSWSYDTGGHVYAVAQDSSGNVYAVGVAADNGDGNGSRNLWKFNSSGNYLDGLDFGYLAGYDAKAIDIDATYIYVSSALGAYRLTHALGSKATITLSGTRQAIRVDSSGNIYLGGGGLTNTLTKYNSSLEGFHIQWSKDTNDSAQSIKLDSNEDVIVGTSDGEVRKYLADGSSPHAGTWAYVVKVGSFIRVEVASGDTIYAVTSNSPTDTQERFVALDSDGSRLWGITTDAGDLERVWIDSSDRVWVVGDDVDTYDTWLVDTTEHTFTDAIVLGADLKDVRRWYFIKLLAKNSYRVYAK